MESLLAGFKNFFDWYFVDKFVGANFPSLLFAQPFLRADHPVPDLPRVVFKSRRWTEQSDGWASARGGKVHGGCIHTSKKFCPSQQPGDLRPVRSAACGLNARAEFCA